MDSNSEPKEKRPRFAQSLDEADIDVIIRDRCPANTRRTTEKWVKALDDFVREKQLSIDIESCSREELAGVLTHFYLEVRRRDGQPYQRNSLLSCRASIQRHLTSLNRDFDLYKDKPFERANAALDGELKRLKREGELQPTRHKPPLSTSDFEALQEYFSQSRPDDAQHLTEKCWFFVTYHFSFRAREVQAGLRKTDLLLQKDQSGEFFSLGTDFCTKNSQGGLKGGESKVSVGRIQDVQQVKAIKLLLSKLNPACDRLFQRAKLRVNAEDPTWFVAAPLGKNTLSEMMPRISEKAGLSQRYTNHSVRATAITRLSAAGVEARHIMAVSGHRSEQSLSSYSAPTSSQQAAMSSLLDNPSSSLQVATLPAPSSSAISGQGIEESDLALDRFLEEASEKELQEFEGGKPIPQPVTTPVAFTGAQFHGCTITFNVNINKK